jgi:saccharopine dehydrogenase-like NADP-dependent oxidoreductase
MKVAIAGGAGRQSLAAVYDFIERKDVEEILLIDISEDALRTRKDLVRSDKVKIKAADIADVNGMANILAPCDAVLNASSHIFNMSVMDACLEAKTNYTDLGGLFHWAIDQLKRHDDFKKAGVTGIVGSGSAPGIVNVLSKYAADRLDSVESVLILDAIINSDSGYKFVPPYALNTIVDEFTANSFEYIDGKHVEMPPFSGKTTVEFPEPYGTLNLYNVLHSEVATMPIAFTGKGIKNVAFKLALPTLFEERLRFLIENGLGRAEKIDVKGVPVAPRDFLLEIFETKPDRKSDSQAVPQDRKLLRVIVSGTLKGKSAIYEVETDLNLHPWGMSNGHFSVGFPAAVTARMLGNGQIKEKGVFSGESVIDTGIYFRELAKRGIRVFAKMIEEV